MVRKKKRNINFEVIEFMVGEKESRVWLRIGSFGIVNNIT